MGVDVSMTDNSREILQAFEEQIMLALDAIGATAEGHAKKECPVDTGRLRNSITYATEDYMGNDSYSDKNGNSFSGGGAQAKPEKHAVYIGTNVEYAAAVEYRDKAKHETGNAHFLKNAATNHGDEYKRIMEAALKD